MRKKIVKRRVYKERRIAFLLLLIFIIVFLFSLKFFNLNIFNKGTENVKIYFYDEKSKELVFEKRVIPKFSSIQEKTRRLLEEIISGPKSETLSKVVDPKTKVLSIDLKKDEITISFSKEIKNVVLEGVTGEAASLYSIVNTIIGNTPLRSVIILIEGKENDLYWNSISIASPLTFFSSNLPSGKRVNIYYFDKNYEYPIVLSEEIPEAKDNLELAKLIFSKLKAGPSSIYSNKVYKTIPDEAYLKDVKIEGDSIYLNLTSDILNYRGFGSSTEYAFMYSTILSFTEIPGINKVIFQVDGKNVESIGGNFDTSKPLTRWYYDLYPPPEGMYGYPIYYIYEIDGDLFLSPKTILTDKKDSINIIFNSLLNPPNQLKTLIPSNTKILSSKIDREILYLDLDMDLSKIDSLTKEKLLLKQIVFTFTDALNISEVDLKIKGKKTKFPFGTSIDKPLNRNSLWQLRELWNLDLKREVNI